MGIPLSALRMADLGTSEMLINSISCSEYIKISMVAREGEVKITNLIFFIKKPEASHFFSRYLISVALHLLGEWEEYHISHIMERRYLSKVSMPSAVKCDGQQVFLKCVL